MTILQLGRAIWTDLREVHRTGNWRLIGSGASVSARFLRRIIRGHSGFSWPLEYNDSHNQVCWHPLMVTR